MRFFHRLLLLGVLAVVSRPRRTLLLAAVALAVCIVFAAAKLRISTDQNKLFDPNVKFFRDYLGFNEKFPENEAIYVVVEPADRRHLPPVPRWTAAADAITQRLRTMPRYVHSVDSRIPIDRLGDQGLLFDEPQRVQQSFAEMKRFIPLVQLWGEPPTLATRLLGSTPIGRFIAAVGLQPADAQTAEFVAMLAKTWNSAIEHVEEPLKVGTNMPDLASLDAADPSRLGYYYQPQENDPSNHLLLVRVYHRTDYSTLTAISETVDAIRAAVAE